MASPFLFNGVEPPIRLGKGYLEETEQLTDGGRNVLGKTVAKPINDRLIKFSNIVFPKTSLEGYNWIRNNIENFEVNLTYYDTRLLRAVTRKFYFGPSSAEPSKWDKNAKPVMKPIEFKNVKVNIIDMG